MNHDLMAVYASLGQGRVKLHAALREAADAYPDDLVLAGRIREIEDYLLTATARIQRYIREDLDRLYDAEGGLDDMA